MKLILRSLVFVFIISMFWSCNNSAKESREGKNEISKNQSFVIDDSGITVAWTAYKFTDKIAVTGTFDDYSIKKHSKSGSVENLLTKLRISIPTDSVDAMNAIRDFKLRSSFFDAFNTSTINGTILKVNESKGFVRLKMNKISKNIPFTYSLVNDTISIFTKLDLKKWKGEEALSRIERECVEHLKGVDGISKLWPEIDVEIKIPLRNTNN